MRDLQRICLALVTTLALLQPTFADEPDDGEMAATIRSADYPCDHVLDMQAMDVDDWRVQCNSGTYEVTRDENGQSASSRSTGSTDSALHRRGPPAGPVMMPVVYETNVFS